MARAPAVIDIEGKLRFSFDERWVAFKWDDSLEYSDGLKKHPSTLQREEKVGLVLWCEDMDPAVASAYTTKTEGLLSWMKPKVIVTNRSLLTPRVKALLGGIDVTSLAGAPS